MLDYVLMTGLASAFRVLAAAAAALLAVTATAPAAGARSGPKAPEEFVALSSVDPTIIQEMRYPTAHNFMGVPVDGYRDPLCILTRPAARALHHAQTRLLRRGYSLKVYDCYRPQRAVDHFVRWAKDLDDETMKGDAAVRGRVHRGEVRAQPRQHGRSDGGEAAGRTDPAVPAG